MSFRRVVPPLLRSTVTSLWIQIGQMRHAETADPLHLPYRDDLTYVLRGYRSKRWQRYLQWISFSVIGLLMSIYAIAIAPEPAIIKILALPLALVMLFGITDVFPILVNRLLDAMTLGQTERKHVACYVCYLIDKHYDHTTLNDIERAAQVNKENAATIMTLPNALLVGVVGLLAVWDLLPHQSWILLVFWITVGMTLIGYLLNAEQGNANTVMLEGISAYRTHHCPDDTQQPAAPPILTEAEVLHGLARLIQGQMQAVSVAGSPKPAITDHQSVTESKADLGFDSGIPTDNNTDEEQV